jgi:predicted TIM-barrel fold metal-dependent hydrolase
MWATDFPHLDILDDEPSATEELYERLASMPPDLAEAILGRNACELYGLDPAVAVA